MSAKPSVPQPSEEPESALVRDLYEEIQHSMTWMPTLNFDWLYVMLKAKCDPALAQAREAGRREERERMQQPDHSFVASTNPLLSQICRRCAKRRGDHRRSE